MYPTFDSSKLLGLLTEVRLRPHDIQSFAAEFRTHEAVTLLETSRYGEVGNKTDLAAQLIVSDHATAEG